MACRLAEFPPRGRYAVTDALIIAQTSPNAVDVVAGKTHV
jgi:major membrane immunogen (membrane-anchored lipoprotein)